MDAIRDSNDPELRQVLDWSNAVNNSIARMVQGVPPFPGVEAILSGLQEQADVIVVSATPSEALRREWAEHRLDGYVRVIAGQEVGSKSEMLEQAAGGRYEAGHVLMVGDAPGDWRAARSVGALFFPIVPGREEASWQQLQEEGLRRFFDGSFAGSYENTLLEAFQAILPEDPPWAAQEVAP